MDATLFAFNGIDGASGNYLLSPLPPEDISKLAQGEELAPDHLAELQARHHRDTEETFGPIEGVDPKNLAQAGWGVLFAHNADPAVRDALKQLLDHRRERAAKTHEHYYQEYAADKGYRVGDPKESKRTFLARNGAAAGMPADPDKVPYYLLLVGPPESIPYRFQYQLDVEYAVGRLWFEKDGKPDLDAFARYAHSVVEAESGKYTLPRRAAFFGVQNDDDRATQLSATDLVQPLAQTLAQTHAEWAFPTFVKTQARKVDLARLLGGPDTPALLFTASHGMGFPNGDRRQFPHQGAILCQDWPGPRQWKKPIPEDFYFAADHLGADARLLGLIAFHFACYGAGTPALDDFAHLRQLKQRPGIAPHAFVARLPQRLLAHPRGGALAVIGHVERAWSCSFHGGARLGQQLQAFESALTRLLQGHPVGSALEYFNQLYAALSSDLSEELENIKYGKTPDHLGLSAMWTANNDARSYVVLGDPAVRLVAGAAPTAAERPTVAAVRYTPSGQPATTTAPTPARPASPAPSTGRAFDAPAARTSVRRPAVTPTGPRRHRRQRLLQQLQGRTLDQAYLRSDIRRDLEAEAADPDPDRLVTPEQLDFLRELTEGRRAEVSFEAGIGEEAFFSTDQVVLVPGFLGSELSDVAPGGTGLIWISPVLLFSDRLSLLQLAEYDGSENDLVPEVRVEATGVLPVVYDLLRLDLELRRYTVAYHPVDWRKDLDLAADALAGRLRGLANSARPIHVVAHSQGAMVARRALQRLRDNGDDAVLDRVRHLVLLGPANFGSFSAAFALAGSHSTLPLLRRFAVDPAQGFRLVLASMTGLYQLLPFDPARTPSLADGPLGDIDFWQPAGPIDADRLGRFSGWARGIDSEFFNERTAVILGDNHGRPTAAGAAFADGRLVPSGGLDGDGTVTHSCAVLPGTATYLAPRTEHSQLALSRNVIAAVRDLLADRTPRLSRASSDPADHLAERAAPAVREMIAFETPAAEYAEGFAPPVRETSLSVEQLLRAAAAAAAEQGARVRVTIEVDPPQKG